MPEEEGVFTEEEVDRAMEEIEFTPGTWQLVGQTALRVGKRLRIIQADREIKATVIGTDDESASVLFEGDDEPAKIHSRHLVSSREYLVSHKKEGAIVSSVLGITLAGLYVWHRARKK